ncbi:putative helitron helicase-like domain-containing protein [Senna tora]|uniref:ATP-dependent DNA helicase n=1 Tax=Senna tora TaxID=362788 RepID=A0A834TGP7_9FABA|nr:putative helitron helicase-like domain-containing protein [Senna tora]
MDTEQRQEYLTRRRASYQATRALRIREQQEQRLAEIRQQYHSQSTERRQELLSRRRTNYRRRQPTSGDDISTANQSTILPPQNDLCCLNGRVSLPLMPVPLELLSIYNDETEVGRHFRQHIRMYNHIFTLTSMGVHLDGDLANGREGVYSFHAQGAIYHKIGLDSWHKNQILKVVNLFREQPRNRPQYNLPTAFEVAATIFGGEEAGQLNGRDIIVQLHSGHLMNTPDTAGYYDPLQYPLQLPCGTYGWDVNTQNGASSRTKVTCRDYYSYMLQIRDDWDNLLLRGCRLLQQYAVDIFLKMETQKFRWVRKNQSKIRVEMYNGLQDSFEAGINISGHVSRRIILPSSIVGCPRDMCERFQDAMRVVGYSGKQDLFITMTCNPSWDEICDLLLPRQIPQGAMIDILYTKGEIWAKYHWDVLGMYVLTIVGWCPIILVLIDDPEGNNDVPKCIEDELSIPISDTDMQLIDLLNDDQNSAFKSIIDATEQERNAKFYVDSPGGTGKTFLYRALLLSVREKRNDCFSNSFIEYSSYYITRRTFRDTTSVDSSFGGKIVILGGDFWQILPVIPNGSKAQLINASIGGDEMEPVIENDMIKITPYVGIPWEGEDPLNDLIDCVFPDLSRHMNDSSYMVERAILTLTNEEVDKLNDRIIAKYPGDDHILYSFDSVDDDPRNLYQQGFLNSISPSGMPPYVLRLKKGVPIMLLRNIDPKAGLCNGTRLICRDFLPNVIDVEILTGQMKGD